MRDLRVLFIPMTKKKDDGDKEPVVALFGDSFGPSVT